MPFTTTEPSTATTMRRNNANLDLTQLGDSARGASDLENSLLNSPVSFTGESCDDASPLANSSSTLGDGDGGASSGDRKDRLRNHSAASKPGFTITEDFIVGRVQQETQKHHDKLGKSDDSDETTGEVSEQVGAGLEDDTASDLEDAVGEPDGEDRMDAEFTIVNRADAIEPLDAIEEMLFFPTIPPDAEPFPEFDPHAFTQEDLNNLASFYGGRYELDQLDEAERALHDAFGDNVDLTATIHPNEFGPGGFIPPSQNISSASPAFEHPATFGDAPTLITQDIWSQNCCTHTEEHIIVWVVVQNALDAFEIVPHCYNQYPVSYALKMQAKSMTEYLYDPEVRFRALEALDGVPSSIEDFGAYVAWVLNYKSDQERSNVAAKFPGLMAEACERTQRYLSSF